MGNFVTRAGMSQELFRTAYAFIGHLRGGLAMATIVGCAGFGAICGSSIATAATFAKVAYPSMKKFGYSDRLAAGVRSEEHTSELQSRLHLVCRLLLEKKKKNKKRRVVRRKRDTRRNTDNSTDIA